jgi:DNA polymerase-3 subunit alpha
MLAEPPPAPQGQRQGRPGRQRRHPGHTPHAAHSEGPNDFTSAERLQFEKELLGFYVSGHPMNAYAGLADALDTHTDELLLRATASSSASAASSTIAKKLSKKDNRPWAFFNLASKQATIPLNMFADAYEPTATTSPRTCPSSCSAP